VMQRSAGQLPATSCPRVDWHLVVSIVATVVAGDNSIIMLLIKLEISQLDSRLKEWARESFGRGRDRPALSASRRRHAQHRAKSRACGTVTAHRWNKSHAAPISRVPD
jgi:hypothetical protein